MISYNKPSIDQKDINRVVSVLKTRWLTQGKQVEIFEKNLRNKFGSKYCSVVSSGTAALHLALKTLISVQRKITFVTKRLVGKFKQSIKLDRRTVYILT